MSPELFSDFSQLFSTLRSLCQLILCLLISSLLFSYLLSSFHISSALFSSSKPAPKTDLGESKRPLRFPQRRFETETLTHSKLYRRFSQRQRSFYTEKTFTHRNFFTETGKLLQRDKEIFTHRKLLRRASFYTEKPLHSEAFTHSELYTQKLLHREAFTQRSFYTEKLSHTEAPTQKSSLCTGFSVSRLLCVKTSLCKSYSVQKSFCA